MLDENLAYNKLAEKEHQENIIAQLNKMDEKLDTLLNRNAP